MIYKDLFEIKITVVAQGGIKFFFYNNKNFNKFQKFIKNFSDLCSENPARRSLKMIKFLENEKGTLRSTIWIF